MRQLVVLLALAACKDGSKAPATPARAAEAEQPNKVPAEHAPAPEPENPVRALERQATADMVQINAAIQAVDAAQTDADRSAAKAKLVELQNHQAELKTKLAAAKAQAAATPGKDGYEAEERAKALEADAADTDKRIEQAITAVEMAQSEVDRAAAKAKLAQLIQEQKDAKAAAKKAKK